MKGFDKIIRAALVNMQVFMCMLLLSCFMPCAVADTGYYVTKKEIERIFQGDNVDAIIQVTNDVKMMIYKREALEFLRDVWEINKSKYPDLSWDVITKDIVRINIADILIQSNRNREISIDTYDFKSYAMKQIENNDEDVVLIAILALSNIDDAASVKKIYEMTSASSPAISRVAIIALAKMCHQAAEQALNNIERNSQDKEYLEVIQDTRQKYYSVKRLYCSYQNQ